MFKTRLDKLERKIFHSGKIPEFKRGTYFLSKENDSGRLLVNYKGVDITGTCESKALIAKLGHGFIKEIEKLPLHLIPIEVFALPQSDVLIIDDIELRGFAV
jgi:hypothetical protein